MYGHVTYIGTRSHVGYESKS